MKYERKTMDLWDIVWVGPYGKEVVTTETSYRMAKEQVKLYRENAPGIYILHKYRERITQ